MEKYDAESINSKNSTKKFTEREVLLIIKERFSAMKKPIQNLIEYVVKIPKGRWTEKEMSEVVDHWRKQLVVIEDQNKKFKRIVYEYSQNEIIKTLNFVKIALDIEDFVAKNDIPRPTDEKQLKKLREFEEILSMQIIVSYKK